MPRCLNTLALVTLCSSLLIAQSRTGAISGRVADSTGAVIQHATIYLSGLAKARLSTGATGEFSISELAPGEYQVTAKTKGFSVKTQRMTLRAGENRRLDFVLEPGTLAQEVTVFGREIAGNEEIARRTPGAVEFIDSQTLEFGRVFNFSEALRKAAGLSVRDEEGFGLRPNIGIRGLNPTRSTKVLLLEDGIPLAFAPYGDNASYYHPPVERFRSVEVLKGSGQILYGPVTVGGVVNYITPDPPDRFSGSITLLGGNRNYFDGIATVGSQWRGTGILLDYMRKQGEGARDNVRSGLNDLTLKIHRAFAERHQLTLKGNFFTEDSNVTYSGLRADEYAAKPRQNPFRNDFFYGRRHAAALRHTYAASGRVLVSTNVYGSVFTRDWWRQSSNSAQRPNDSGDPSCGGMANLNSTCGNEGRQRMYHTAGVEPRVLASYSFFGVPAEADFGLRAHFEKQYRQQENGPLPTSRQGVLVEDNIRRTQAYSTFLQNKWMIGRLSITPGVRFEYIDFSRTNRLANSGVGIKGRDHLTQVVPGLGLAYAANQRITLFAGAHRGFAPPRVEDLITNTGGTIELDPELSWNYEAGVRTRPLRNLRLDATFFRMDYENQIVPASLAGGLGAALTNGGETLHQGMEFSGRWDTGRLFDTAHSFYLGAAYTFLNTAEFQGVRFSNVPGFGAVSITGNRLPYAPRHNVTTTVGYSHAHGIDAMLEAVHIGGQFGDDLNTVAQSADGQRGLLAANTTWNASLNYRVEQWHSTFFVTVKNVFDDTFIVDRSRGILPNSPRLLQSGLKYTW
jgi:Fe(3+) dicitrate transport protein